MLSRILAKKTEALEDFRIYTPCPRISTLPHAENLTFRELAHAPYSRSFHKQLTTAATKAALRDLLADADTRDIAGGRAGARVVAKRRRRKRKNILLYKKSEHQNSEKRSMSTSISCCFKHSKKGKLCGETPVCTCPAASSKKPKSLSFGSSFARSNAETSSRVGSSSSAPVQASRDSH